MISIDSNIKELTRDLTNVQKKLIPQVASRAINRTARTVFTRLKRQIAKDTGLKQKEIASRFTLIKSNKSTLSALVRMIGRWFNLARFGAKQFKGGVKASAWGQRKMYRGAFIANKGRTVFALTPGARRNKTRLPIKALVGPNPSREFNKQTRDPRFNTTVINDFKKNFSADLKYRLGKLK